MQAGADARLERQRAAFRRAFAAAERGDRAVADEYADLLDGYVLQPWLESAWLRATIGRRSDDELGAFVAAHADHRTGREVALRWLTRLAARGDWARYLEVHDAIGGSAAPRLACLAAQARLLTDRIDADWYDDALALWHSGYSRPDECDPVFDHLRMSGALTAEHVRARLALAIDARQFGLARFLARSLTPDDRARVESWQRMADNPARALAGYPRDSDDADEAARVRYGLLVLGSRDPERAWAHWERLHEAYGANESPLAEAGRRVAIAAARRYRTGADDMLATISPNGSDRDVHTWRTRVALREGNWARARELLGDAADDPRDLFWLGRALEAEGDTDAAERAWARAARSRALYGQLAAERMDDETPRSFGHVPTPLDPLLLAALEARPDILEARELHATGLDSRGRATWAQATRDLEGPALAQAALLAHRWGWHSRAIATAARAGLMDDLEVRYPLAWETQFRTQSEALRIPASWSLGVARNESLFTPDIASGAGAVGLMQLMPATGREVAGEIDLPYQGLSTLIDPEANLRLGTRYLHNMLQRFDANLVVATAAYNAGPGRVSRWLPDDGELDADVWMETIPIDETRDYVQRVLASKAIFHWRQTGEWLPPSSMLTPVGNGARR